MLCYCCDFICCHIMLDAYLFYRDSYLSCIVFPSFIPWMQNKAHGNSFQKKAMLLFGTSHVVEVNT